MTIVPLGLYQECMMSSLSFSVLASSRCHGEFGTPDLWHPCAKYPREIGTPKQNTLREFSTPLCTPLGNLASRYGTAKCMPANQGEALLNL